MGSGCILRENITNQVRGGWCGGTGIVSLGLEFVAEDPTLP